MGNSSSLEQLDPLHRIASSTPISQNDAELWQQLFSLQLPSSSAEELAAASYSFCAEMVRNNPSSGNFQSLIRRAIDLLHLASKPKATGDPVRQACDCIFFVRLFLKHMIETLPPSELVGHLTVPNGAAGSGPSALCEPLVEALLAVLVHCELNAETYWLHMESTAALLVGMSTQLYADLTVPTAQPFLLAVLSSGGTNAELLVQRLLTHVIERPVAPTPPRGILRAIGGAIGTVLLLPYYTVRSVARNVYYIFASADADAGAGPLSLADRSLHLLLLLTQHLPPALFTEGALPSNAFLDALRALGNEQPFDKDTDDPDDPDDPEGGKLRARRVPFKELHDALAAALPEPGAALLLYLLLHGNTDFLEYALSRTDPEALLTPLLRLLHESRSLPPNQLYMVLIILLLLSQDVGLMAATQTAMVSSVPWYTERVLGPISVGSLLVLLLVRTVQSNLAKGETHDAYVNTNCLAALANVAPTLRKMHPAAARGMLALVDVFIRKYSRHARRAGRSDAAVAADSAELSATPGGTSADGGASADGDAEGLQLAADCLRIALEVINLTLSAGPAINEHLVYSLLERPGLVEPLRGHEQFSDLLENLDLVLEFFGATLNGPAPGAEGGDPTAAPSTHTVATVLGHIRDVGREWRGERMRAFPDLKFTYEQEAHPEEFFTPYLWNVVYDASGIGWSSERLVLFPTAGDYGGASGGSQVTLPPLTEVDVVDEGACGPIGHGPGTSGASR